MKAVRTIPGFSPRCVPRGPDSSRTWEEHSWWSSCGVSPFEWSQGYLVATTRWATSPIYGRGLTIFSSNLKLLAVRIGGRFTPGSWQSSSPARFRDAPNGRRPRHAKRCCLRQPPLASKKGRRLVLMNHRYFRRFQNGCILLKTLVGERGFEPPTPWSRTRFHKLLKSVES